MPSSSVATLVKSVKEKKPNSPPQLPAAQQDSAIKFYNYHEYFLRTPGEQDEQLGYHLPELDDQQQPVLLTHFQNPYIPVSSSSANKATTRIVRIPREFHSHGDLFPQFSTVFPGEEAGALVPDHGHNAEGENSSTAGLALSSVSPLKLYLSHDELRSIVESVNGYLMQALSPYGAWNIFDFLLNLMFCWLLDLVRDAHSKRRLKELEEYIQYVNRDLQERGKSVRFISPLRSGYLSVCVTIFYQ